MTSKLFIDDLVPIDEFYGMIRDCKREEVLNGKCYMEHLWERYYKYADKDFPQKLSEDFHARFWEMYLTCTLLENNHNICPKNVVSEGPDILIRYLEQTIYLEAITPSEGSEDNKDKVPRMTLNKVMRVPDEQITLRYCSAIEDKYKKYTS